MNDAQQHRRDTVAAVLAETAATATPWTSLTDRERSEYEAAATWHREQADTRHRRNVTGRELYENATAAPDTAPAELAREIRARRAR